MTLAWTDTFLKALSRCPNVSAAAEAAGISRQYAYRIRDEDPDFAAAWQDAVDQSTDSLVGECYRRARDGVTKPVFQGGQHVGDVQEYSDTLAIFLLKSHRRAVYGDKMDLNATHRPTGELAEKLSQLSTAELDVLLSLAEKLAGGPAEPAPATSG
jgi:hypothetical protein